MVNGNDDSPISLAYAMKMALSTFHCHKACISELSNVAQPWATARVQQDHRDYCRQSVWVMWVCGLVNRLTNGDWDGELIINAN